MVMRRVDNQTGQQQYVPVPCGNTRESECPHCAQQARNLRIQQCREGWHLTREPIDNNQPPTESQTALFTHRCDLTQAFTTARDNNDTDTVEELREEIRVVDERLRATGFRGRLLPPDADQPTPRKHRSTRRRQDAPDLPRRKITTTTLGQVFAGKFRPSMFVTLTLPGYGKVHPDGTPVRPEVYDYQRAARDVVHFSALFDRWVQNLRRVVGWDVQYFATVEPQRRGAPHLHIALRGAITRETIRTVTAATYHQVWWPNHNQPVYTGSRMPVWDHRLRTFTDPDTGTPLTSWDDALDTLVEDAQPVHVVRFGTQVDVKGILGGTEESGRHIGYLTKYLTKSIGEILHPDTDRQHAHHDRLHTELEHTPCSPRCPIWLAYGIIPLGATATTRPGRCKAKAHRRTTLGLPGRRVLVSRKWSGKTLPDHRADREAFVRQLLADIGINKPTPDPTRFTWTTVRPGDPAVPRREHLLMAAIAQRTTWRAEYNRAKITAGLGPPGQPHTSATQPAA